MLVRSPFRGRTETSPRCVPHSATQCPRHAPRSERSLAGVVWASPSGDLYRLVRLLTTLCDRTLVPFCQSVSALEAAAVEYTCTGGGTLPRGYPTTLSGASDRTRPAPSLAESSARFNPRPDASGNGGSFGRDWYTRRPAQTSRKILRLALRTDPQETHSLPCDQKGCRKG